MKKKDFIHAIDNFNLDDNLKYQVKRKVELNMKKSQTQDEKKKSYRGRKVAIFSACLIAVMGISVMPIMADDTSLLENLMSKIQVADKNTQDYSNPVVVSTTSDAQNDTNTVTSVSDTQPQLNNVQDVMSVYVNNYYCDGETLLINWGIKGNDEGLSRCNHIVGDMNIKINGETLDNDEKSTECFYGGSNQSGQYVGQIKVDVSNVENIENSSVDIDFSNFVATDFINYNFNYDTLEYESFGTDTYNQDVSFSFNIDKTNEPDYYEVNKTEGDLTVNNVIVSPSCTQIDVDINGEYFLLIHDNLGNELEWDSSVNENTYDTPNIEATSLNIEIYPIEEKNKITPTPSYVVNVPIKCGYNVNNDNQSYTENLNPPIEEIKPLLKQQAEKSAENCVSIGTPDNTTLNNSDENYTINITGYKFLDTLDGFNLMDKKEYLENGKIKDGYKVVSIDVTVTNNLDTDTTSDNKFYNQFAIRTNTLLDNYFYSEPIGFSPNSDYTMDFSANETKSYQICFIVSNDVVDMPLICSYWTGDNNYFVRLQ